MFTELFADKASSQGLILRACCISHQKNCPDAATMKTNFICVLSLLAHGVSLSLFPFSVRC